MKFQELPFRLHQILKKYFVGQQTAGHFARSRRRRVVARVGHGVALLTARAVSVSEGPKLSQVAQLFLERSKVMGRVRRLELPPIVDCLVIILINALREETKEENKREILIEVQIRK